MVDLLILRVTVVAGITGVTCVISVIGVASITDVTCVMGEKKPLVFQKTVMALEGEPFVLRGCHSHSL